MNKRVSLTSTVNTEIGVEPSVLGHVLLLVESEMPLSDHVCGVAGLLQLVCQGRTVQRETVGLRVPDVLVLETCVDLGGGGGAESRYTGAGDLYVSGRGDRVKIYWCWRPLCIWGGGTESRYTGAGDLYVSGRGDRVKIYWCWRPVCIWEGGQSQDILVLETCMYLGGGTESRYTGAGDLYVSGRGDRVKIYWC